MANANECVCEKQSVVSTDERIYSVPVEVFMCDLGVDTL